MISEVLLNRVLYFGCWSANQTGHYLVDRYRNSVRSCNYGQYGIPFRELYWLDGLFTNTREQSKAQLAHFPSWTIMWMPDYSADKRGGSCAAFMVPVAKLTVPEMLEYARVAFPDQVARIEAASPIVDLRLP